MCWVNLECRMPLCSAVAMGIRELGAIAETGHRMLVPVNFPSAYDVSDLICL